ncbi:MAG: carboxypeptidase regulatory-like domain-containing protein, partial [Calditrichia bacterium]|nr:carboxypeptidase regulatory-like domain-containing protein [Calditrichia bacterium]
MALLTMVMSLSGFAGNYQFNNQQSEFFIVDKSGTDLQIGANFNRIISTTIEEDGRTFDRISIPGFHTSMEDGMPEVPVMNKFIEVAHGGKVTVKVLSYDEKTYSAKELGINNPLYPHQPPRVKSVDVHPFSINENAYMVNAFNEREMVQVVETVIARGTRMALVQFSPFRYNPVTREFKVYSNIVFEVSVENADMFTTMAKYDRYNNTYYSTILDSRVLRSGLVAKEDLTRNPINYLIICADEFMDNARLADFVAWKTQKGFHVTLVSVTDAGGSNTGIQTYIQNAYDNDPVPPSFILFVGDNTNMPTNSLPSHVSDNAYVWVDGSDFVIDIYHGRFSADNPAELETQIDKTLMYEQYTMSDPSYLNEMMGTAGWDAGFAVSHGYPQINYFEQYYNDPAGWTMYKYLSAGSHQNDAEIIGHYSDGVAFYNYTAHCSPSGMADPSFTTSDIPGLANDEKYSLTIGNCCSSNEFQQNSPDCFGEQMLYTANKGAVGYIGGSNSTYWDEDLWYGVGYYANITGTGDAPPIEETGIGAYDGVMTEGYITNEGMNFAGLLAVEESTSGRKQYYWEIYHLMGDPSVATYWGEAEEITPVYNDAIFVGASSFDVAVPGIENALVCITMNGEILGTTFTDASGNAAVTFDGPIIETGTATITVTGQNIQPVMNDVLVIVPADVSIDPTSVVINTETAVTVTVLDDEGAPMEGVNIWAEGINYATTPVATDASGVAVVTVNYPYGPALNIIGKRPADSYNLFTEILTVTGGSDFTAADFAVSTDIGLVDTFAMNLPGTLTLTADPAQDFFTYQLNGNAPVQIDAPANSVEITPNETGVIYTLAAKDGYNIVLDTFQVIRAYGTLSGILYDEDDPKDGKGIVAEAEIRFYAQDADPETEDPVFTATTNESGAYAVDGEQEVASYDIYIDKFGFEPFMEEDFFLTYGVNTHNMVMYFAASGIISGTIADTAGAGLVANVKVYRSDNGELYEEVNSDESGAYTVTLPNFTYNFRVKAPGYKLVEQEVAVNGDATLDFELELTSGILIVNDDPGKWRDITKPNSKESEKESAARTKAGESADAFTAILDAYGVTDYTLETEAETDPAAWMDYDMVIWSSGNNIDPVSDAMATNLVDFINTGGLLLIEGGEIGYDHQSDAFATTVLHITDWAHDASGDLNLADVSHPIAIAPFTLSSTIAHSY